MKPSYETRYKTLKKVHEALCTKYDALKVQREADLTNFAARTARWTIWKRDTMASFLKIKGISTPSKTAKPSDDHGQGQIPCMAPSSPLSGQSEAVVPSGVSRRLMRTALVNSCMAKIRQMDAEDEEFQKTLGVPLKHQNRIPALDVTLKRSPSPHPVKPLEEVAVTFGGPDVRPYSPFSMVATPRRPPSPTVSEDPLSQLPQARLRDLELDEEDSETDSGPGGTVETRRSIAPAGEEMSGTHGGPPQLATATDAAYALQGHGTSSLMSV